MRIRTVLAIFLFVLACSKAPVSTPGYYSCDTDLRADMQEVWSYKSTGPIYSSPAVYDNNILIATGNRAVVLDLTTGKELWSYSFDGLNKLPVGWFGTTAVVSNGENKIYGINNGALAWESAAAHPITSILLWSNWLAYGSSHGFIYLSGGKNASTQWKKEEQSEIIDIVADETKLYTIQQSGKIHAWDPKTGNEIWTQNLRKMCKAGACLYKNTLFLAERFGTIFAVDTESGKIYWQKSYPSDYQSRPIVINDIAIFGTEGDFLLGVNANTGEKLWSANIDGRVRADIIATPSGALVSTQSGQLLVVNPATGAIITKRAIAGGLLSAPICVGNTFIIATVNGNVFAYR